MDENHFNDNSEVARLLHWWRYQHGGFIEGLARELDVTANAIWYWARVRKKIPLQYHRRLQQLGFSEFDKEDGRRVVRLSLAMPPRPNQNLKPDTFD